MRPRTLANVTAIRHALGHLTISCLSHAKNATKIGHSASPTFGDARLDNALCKCFDIRASGFFKDPTARIQLVKFDSLICEPLHKQAIRDIQSRQRNSNMHCNLIISLSFCENPHSSGPYYIYHDPSHPSTITLNYTVQLPYPPPP